MGVEDSESTHRLRNWVLHGAPKSWDQTDVLSFLRENSWEAPDIVTRRKPWTKGAHPEWIFRAFAPPGTASEELFAHADEFSYLTVTPEGPRAKRKMQSTPVPGLKKRWVDKSAQEEPGPTQMDEIDLCDAHDDGQGPKPKAAPRSRNEARPGRPLEIC